VNFRPLVFAGNPQATVRHEELQAAYWVVHLGVVTELNTRDSFCLGHLDQHLEPFYAKGLADGALTRESAMELLECFWVKFNNQPALPKVGVTAAESGTYTDFANINVGGLRPDGSNGVNDVSYLLLDVIDDMHLPSKEFDVNEETASVEIAGLIRGKGGGRAFAFYP